MLAAHLMLGEHMVVVVVVTALVTVATAYWI